MRKVFCTLFMLISMFLVSGQADAKMVYSGYGMAINLPEGFEYVNPSPRFVMEAHRPYSGTNVNISVTPINFPEPSESELEIFANRLRNDFQNRGLKVKSADVLNRYTHQCVHINFTDSMGLIHMQDYLFIHNKRYIITYTYSDEKEGFADSLFSLISFKCTTH